jgi:hypothetical protein
VTGTIHGQPISVANAISASVTRSSLHFAAILLGSTPNLCADQMTNTEHPNQASLVIWLFDFSTGTAPTMPGTFSIYQSAPPPMAAMVSAEFTDASCQAITADSVQAMTGTVTLTSVSGNAFDGSFDVALDSGDHVTGDFAPEECPAIQTALDMSGVMGPCV